MLHQTLPLMTENWEELIKMCDCFPEALGSCHPIFMKSTCYLLRPQIRIRIVNPGKKEIPRSVLWQLDNSNLWDEFNTFWIPLPLVSPPQSNNSAQYGCLRNRWCYSALKTVKPYYGNRYQISLSNRFCHPMKNCWQQGSVLVTIWKTVLIWMISRTSVRAGEWICW